MPDAIPFWFPADSLTCLTSAAVTGQTLVAAVANQTDGRPVVATCGAGVRPLGVAGFDQVPGDGVTVYRKGVLPVLASAAMATGTGVQSDANGNATPVVAGGTAFGTLVADVTLGAVAQVAFD